MTCSSSPFEHRCEIAPAADSALHVCCVGARAAKHVVLLVHGLLGSMATWQPLLERCFWPRSSFHVVAVDLLGHGQSFTPRYEARAANESGMGGLSYSLAEHMTALLGVVDAHKYVGDCCCCCGKGNSNRSARTASARRSLHIVGYSLGSLLALELARVRSCASLALLACPYFTTLLARPGAGKAARSQHVDETSKVLRVHLPTCVVHAQGRLGPRAAVAGAPVWKSCAVSSDTRLDAPLVCFSERNSPRCL